MMIVVLTLVLPQLSPFAMSIFGVTIPVNATQVNSLQAANLINMSLVIAPFILVSVLAGLWWNVRQWLINAGVFYGIFILLFTTFFTNGAGFFTGLVGSLGYWLAQQAVERGSQPWYYYLLVQIPVYEYLTAIGVILAVIVRGSHESGRWPVPTGENEASPQGNDQPAPVFSLL
jgi:hypothetical protein